MRPFQWKKKQYSIQTSKEIGNFSLIDALNKQIKLLFESTSAEIKRRGSLSTVLQFNTNSIKSLAEDLLQSDQGTVELEAVSLRSSDTADPVSIDLRIKESSIR